MSRDVSLTHVGELATRDGGKAMPAVRVLVTGSTGRLGPHVIRALGAHGTRCCPPVFTISRCALAHASHYQIDITHRATLAACLRQLAPTHIIHLAAMTSPAQAHFERDLAWRTNVEAVETLVIYSKQSGARLILASTDFVFRGDLERPYTEADQPDPQTFYGRTKLAAEELITGCDGLITRLSLIYRPRNGGRLSWFTQSLGGTPRTRNYYAAADEYRSPLHPADAASAIVMLSFMNVNGVFHLGGPEILSAYELALREAEATGSHLNVRRISRVSLLPPGRPKNAALDASKLNLLCPGLRFVAVAAPLHDTGGCRGCPVAGYRAET